MPAISANNTTLLRRPYHAIRNLKINLFGLEAYATAKVNQSSFTYPLLVVTVDTVSADWNNAVAGQYVRITDPSTGIVKYEGVVRISPTATELRIGRIVQGDTGRATEIAQSLADNDDVTIYTSYVPFADFSLVDESDPTIFYKRWEREYDVAGNPRNAYPRPVMVAGPWRQFNSDGSAVQWGVNLGDSYSLISGTVTYNHGLADGVTIVTGTATDASVTVEAGPGQYAYRFSLDNSSIPYAANIEGLGRRFYFVNDDTIYPAFSDRYALEITSDKEDIDAGGREIVMRVYGQAALDELYTGAPVLMTYDVVTSANGRVWDDLEDGIGRRSFSGYVREYQAIFNDSGGVIGAEVVVQSPLVFARSLPIAAQELSEVSTVTNWQEVPTAINDMEFWLLYLTRWHIVSLGRLHDMDITDAANFKRSVVATAGGNFKAAADSIAALAMGTFTASNDGTMRFRRNPCVEGTSYRSSVPNVWTWQAGDLRDGLEYNRNPLMRAGQMDGGFTVYNAGVDDPYMGRFALYAPAQGVEKAEVDDFIALSLSDGLSRIGHRFAEYNRPTSAITVRPRGLVGEFVDVSAQEYHTLDFATYDPFNTGMFAARRAVPQSVTRTWRIDARGVVCDASIEMKPETQGVAATRLVLPTSQGGGVVPRPSWCKTFDFTASDGGWTAAPTTDAPWALYTAGVGWGTNDVKSLSSVTYHRIVSISRAVSSATVTSMEVHYSYTQGTEAFNSSADDWAAFRNGTQNHVYNRSSAASSFAGVSQVRTFSFSGATTSLQAQFMTSWDNSAPYTFSGSSTITKIIVRGTGVNPFGASDCI